VEKVFISGSRSIKTLPSDVVETLESIVKKNYYILIGDAYGVDTIVQKILYNQFNYKNVTVYTIFEQPRNLVSFDLNIKRITVPDNVTNHFRRQQYKDIAMTQDCDYGLVIWDGKSEGSFANIKRLAELNKLTKVYILKNKTIRSFWIHNIQFLERIL